MDNDSITPDRGFVGLNISSLLGGRAHLTKEELKESQTIASVRKQDERTITRIKKLKALNHITLNHIWTVWCILCNLWPSLIQKIHIKIKNWNKCKLKIWNKYEFDKSLFPFLRNNKVSFSFKRSKSSHWVCYAKKCSQNFDKLIEKYLPKCSFLVKLQEATKFTTNKRIGKYLKILLYKRSKY